MAIGKNKNLGKKKPLKKRTDPFARKEWYDVKAPNSFEIRQVGKTLTTKTIGNKVARDSLVGRVFEASLGDLKKNAEDEAFRKFKLKVEDVQGKECLTNFYGMDLSTDKLRSLVRKWHSLIEAHADVKTTDGYFLRLFCIGFTTGSKNQTRKTSYAQNGQVRSIRKKMVEVMTREAQAGDLNELVTKLQLELIGRDIEKAAKAIYPLQNVLVRKVKVLRAPKMDTSKLLEMHGGAAAFADVGKKVERDENAEAAAPAEVDKNE